MAESNLIQEVKKALRITTTMFDDEISAEIDACLLDMRGQELTSSTKTPPLSIKR